MCFFLDLERLEFSDRAKPVSFSEPAYLLTKTSKEARISFNTTNIRDFIRKVSKATFESFYLSWRRVLSYNGDLRQRTS